MNKPAILSLALAIGLNLGCQTQADDQLNTEYDRSEVMVEGVPGSATLETEELLARVSAVDRAKRSFTLTDEQGNRRTFQAPAQMRNFDQLKVGDRVRAQVGVERVVQLREPGQPAGDGAAGVLGTAAEGDKPGLVMVETLELTAIIKAMDSTLRTATLQFADGSLRTVQVRPDVEMKSDYLGRELVLSITRAVVIEVQPQ